MTMKATINKANQQIAHYGSLLKIAIIVFAAVCALAYSIFLLLKLYKLLNSKPKTYEPIRSATTEAQQSSPDPETKEQTGTTSEVSQGEERAGTGTGGAT